MSETSKQNYLEAFNEFYRLKHQYEDNYRKKKVKIINNDSLSKREKREELKKIKRPCLICKRNVGMRFSQKDDMLQAECGDQSKPCRFSIQLQRAKYSDKNAILENINSIMEDSKLKIILIKLNILFGYNTEEEGLAEFEQVNAEIQGNDALKNIIDSDMAEFLENINKRAILDQNEITLYTKVQEIKSLVQKYEETEDIRFLSDSVEILVNDVILLNKKIMEQKYEVSRVDYDSDDGTYHLIQRPFTLNSYPNEQIDGEPSVLKFNLKK